MANVATITISVLANTAKFTLGLKKSKAEANKFGREVKKALTAVVSVTTVTVGAFIALSRQSIKTADAVGKTAKAVGLSAETLQELRFAAKQSGVEVRGADDSFRRFNRRLGEFATSGGGPAALGIKALGIEVRTTSGRLKSSETVFNEVVDEMLKIESQAQRAALAAQLFGDDFGPKLTPLLDQGTAGINRLRQEARDLGIVMSNETVAGAERAEETFGRLDSLVRGNLTRAFAENADAIEAATTAMINFVVESIKGFNALRKFFGLETEEEKLRERIVSLTDQIREGRELISSGQAFQAVRGPRDTSGGVLGISGAQLTQDIKAIGAGAEGAKARIAGLESELTATVNQLKELVKLKGAFAELETPGPQGSVFGVGGTTADDLKVQLAQVESLRRSVETPLEGLLRFGEELDKVTGPGLLTATENMELFGRKSIEVFESIRRPVKKVASEMSIQWKQAVRNMQDTLAEFIFNGFQDGLRGMLRAWVNTLKQMVANLVASKLLTSFFSLFPGADPPTGGGGTSPGPPAALGGFRRDRPFIAGDNGPELVSPGAGSTITPAFGGTLFFETNVTGTGLSAEELAAVMQENNRQQRAEFIGLLSRGAFR